MKHKSRLFGTKSSVFRYKKTVVQNYEDTPFREAIEIYYVHKDVENDDNFRKCSLKIYTYSV